MGNILLLVAMLTLWVGTASCAWFGVIEVREDVFMDQPLWEVEKFQTKATKAVLTRGSFMEEDRASKVCEKVKAPDKDNLRKTRFEKLAHQVIHEDIFVLTANREGIITAEASALPNDAEDIPPSLYELKVTKKLFNAVIAEYEWLGVVVHCINGQPMKPRTITNDWLWPGDFKELEVVLSKESWNSIEKNQTGSKYSHLRGHTNNSLDAKDLFKAYLMAYYTGSYVDRFGHALAKPELNFPLKNEVIVTFVSILYDALWDYSLYLVNKDGPNLGDPIVYEWENNAPKYINPEVKEPTFAKFLIAAKIVETVPPFLKGILEQVIKENDNKKDEEGLTRREVCVIHYLSGLSGEASQGLAGLIVRSLGGANLGFVVGYGKYSIGDNQMLVKLIDASVERFSKRSADLLFSDILYNVRYVKSGTNFNLETPDKYPKIDKGWLQEHLKLAAILKCFEKKS